MPRTNFSKDEQKVLDLALDLSRENFSLHIDGNKITKKDLENHLKDTINNDILRGATLFQAYRRNNIVLFEIIEEIVNLSLSEDVIQSPFIQRYVEVKNRLLGDQTAFYAEGTHLVAATFAGNHWDTNRQAIDVGGEVVLPKEWVYVHVYDELDRFLRGLSTMDKLVEKVFAAINKYIQDRLYAMFTVMAEYVPTEFSATGNNEEAVGKLVDLVQAAGGFDKITILGTRGALRKLANIIPDKMFANSQKEAKAATGDIQTWDGNELTLVPQTLKKNDFKLVLPEDTIVIIGNDRPFKLEICGDTRTDSDTTGKKNNDQSVDLQVQTLLGFGCIPGEAYGVFKFI